MTLTQLSAFVLVARLGSVKAAARALGVSEPAVSQALAALRKHFDEDLIVRRANGMTLTECGQRLVPIASQMVSLGVQLESMVRSVGGSSELVRVVVSPEIAEFVAPGVLDAFTRRVRGVDVALGVATGSEMTALVSEWLADLSLGPRSDVGPDTGVTSEPLMRCQLIVTGAPDRRVGASTPWLVDASAADPVSPVARLLRDRRVPDSRLRVFPSLTAAWDAAADGAGIAPGVAHLLLPYLRRGRLRPVKVPGTPVEFQWFATTAAAERHSPALASLQSFLRTPAAMQLMHRPGQGVPRRRFRPPVYVTIWNEERTE